MSGYIQMVQQAGSDNASGTMDVLGGVSSYIENMDQAKNYRRNAELAKQQAKNTAAQEKEKYRQLAGTQAAVYGASGVDVNVGSAADQLAATEAEGEVSAMMALYGGEVEAANWKTQAHLSKWAARRGLLGGVAKGFLQMGGMQTGKGGADGWISQAGQTSGLKTES